MSVTETTPAVAAEPEIKSDLQLRMEEHYNTLISRGQIAWQRLQSDETFEGWCSIGRALDAGRKKVMFELGLNKPAGKGYTTRMGQWLDSTGFAAIDKGVRSRLQTCIDQLPAIEAWRKTLPLSNRLQLNHPNSVLRKFKAATETPDTDDEGEGEGEGASKPKKAKRETAAKVALLEDKLKEAREEIERLQAELAERDRQLAALAPVQQSTAAAVADQLAELSAPDAAVQPPVDPDVLIDRAMALAAETGQPVNLDDPLLLHPENIPAPAPKPKRSRKPRPGGKLIKAAIAAQAPLSKRSGFTSRPRKR